MNKREFLSQLEKALSGLPPKDVEGYLTFYSEMIDDRMEDGLTEGEAIQKIGPAGRIAAQITADAPAAKTAEQKGDVPKRSGWKTALLVIGAPLRLSLLLAALAVSLRCMPRWECLSSPRGRFLPRSSAVGSAASYRAFGSCSAVMRLRESP